jgi:hypothetical protein
MEVDPASFSVRNQLFIALSDASRTHAVSSSASHTQISAKSNRGLKVAANARASRGIPRQLDVIPEEVSARHMSN